MYSIVVLLAIVSTYLLVDALEGGRRRVWIAYAIVTTAMFYTHVSSVLVFVAHALFVGLTFRTWRRQWSAIVIAGAALTVPYLPIAVWALKVVGGGVVTWHADISLIGAFKTVAIRFATFRSRPEIEFRAGWLFFLTAVGGGAWLLVDRRRRGVGILLAVLALVPVFGLFALSLRNSVFSDRYVIVALPAYLILIAIGFVALSRSRFGMAPAVIVAAALLAYTWVPLDEVNRSSIAQKEDWRGAYAWIAEEAEPNDVFLMHPGYMISTLAYYGQRDERLAGHPVATIPSFAPDWMTREVMVDIMREEHGASTRFWLIESPDRVPFEDPDDQLERWLVGTGVVLDEYRVNGVRLLLVELPAGW
jgi:mannosyltransferase